MVACAGEDAESPQAVAALTGSRGGRVAAALALGWAAAGGGGGLDDAATRRGREGRLAAPLAPSERVLGTGRQGLGGIWVGRLAGSLTSRSAALLGGPLGYRLEGAVRLGVREEGRGERGAPCQAVPRRSRVASAGAALVIGGFIYSSFF